MRAATIRLDDTVLARLDGLAQSSGRSRSHVIQEALARYREYETWFAAEVQAGLAEADAGDFATGDEEAAFRARWGLRDAP